MHALKYLGNVMTDKTFIFLHQFYGIYKTRITLTIVLSIIYVISIILCSLQIMPFFAAAVAVIYIIELIGLHLYDTEEFERRYMTEDYEHKKISGIPQKELPLYVGHGWTFPSSHYLFERRLKNAE